MLKPEHPDLSLAGQCGVLGISRSSVYYKKRPASEADLALMRLIDEQYLKTPFYGSRSMRNYLRRLGHKINRKRVQRLMRLMGLEAIYPKPKTSKQHPEHKIYPYLLKDLVIDRPNQVWAADITYIPMRRGFMYLVAVMDWYSRKVLSWKLSNTLEAEFCVAALEEAIKSYGCPEIFNTDQGSQFTSEAFTGLLASHAIQISMDGKGRFHDNIFIERLWWTVKHQYLYLRTFDGGSDLQRGLKGWFCFYNRERPHQSLNNKTPDEVYSGDVDAIAEAA
jgi:putative transposase